MEMKIARVISYLFHPLLLPVYTLVLLLNLECFGAIAIPLFYKALLVAIVMLVTFVVPVALTWFLGRLGLVSSMLLASREERMYPVLSVAVFYYMTFYLLRGSHFSAVFSYYMLGATLLAILALVINFYRKISLHMIGAGGFTGLFIGLALNTGISFTPEILTGILLAGVVGFARLKSNSHDPADIYTGFAMGALTMTLVMFFA